MNKDVPYECIAFMPHINLAGFYPHL